MNIHPGVMGIDISKSFLDVFDAEDGHSRVPNRADEVASLARRCAGRGLFVLFEATGHYDAVLRHALSDAGVAFVRVNPARARDFARAAGYLAKTDAVDAKMLAAMAQSLEPEIRQAPSRSREQLALSHKRRDQLVAMRQQERTRRSECADPAIAASLDEHLAFLTTRIREIERAIRQQLASDAEMVRLQELLQTAPGVGLVTVTTLIALLPELGRRSPKTIAALAGLAPFNRDSGNHRGQRTIQGGRKRVRDALYMAALVATRSRKSSPFRATYLAMKQAGKPSKVALIAIARKLLVVLNAIAREQIPFKYA